MEQPVRIVLRPPTTLTENRSPHAQAQYALPEPHHIQWQWVRKSRHMVQLFHGTHSAVPWNDELLLPV